MSRTCRNLQFHFSAQMVSAIACLALSWSWAHINVCTESCVWHMLHEEQ